MVNSYGCIPDVRDPRDYKVTDHPQFWPFRKADIPKSVDLRPQETPVRDQQNLGACTGFGVAGAFEFLHNKAFNDHALFSPLFVYWFERYLENSIDSDSGAQIRDGMKVLSNFGVCKETTDPYNTDRFTVPPSPEMRAEALLYRSVNYHRVEGVDQYKRTLALGYPVVLGFAVYQSFGGPWSAKGHMPMPRRGEKLLGGHCVKGVGYQDDIRFPGGGYAIVKNQWGPDWGDAGYFYMPYAYLKDRRRVTDCWTVLG